MSYYQRQQRANNNASRNQPAVAKRLLPEHCHDVFRLELNRLNRNGEVMKENGLLFDSDLYNDDKANKYNLSCVYIGELFRFRLKISNKLNESLNNFGLLCNITETSKGSSSPSTQLYPRPRELCPTTIDVSDNVCIDLSYNVSSGETATYSIIINVTASNQDDDSKIYKQMFEFRALPCIELKYSKQTLEENLFVEAIMKNVCNQPQLSLSVDVGFKCMALFKAYKLTHHQSNTNEYNDNDLLQLESNEEKTVLFQIEMKNPTSLVNLNALSVGQIEIKWKSAESNSREGMFLSDVIQRRSLFCRKLLSTNMNENSKTSANHGTKINTSQNIEILILKCPSSCIVHSPFTVTFHIFNLDHRFNYRLWLSIDRNQSGYLLPCNICNKYLGVLQSSSSIKTDMDLIAFVPGIHVLTGIQLKTQVVNHYNNNQEKQNIQSYESSHFIYADVDEQFNEQRKKLKAQKEKMNNDVDDVLVIGDVDDVDLGDDDVDGGGVDDSDNKINDEDDDDNNNEYAIAIKASPKHKPLIPPESELLPIGPQNDGIDSNSDLITSDDNGNGNGNGNDNNDFVEQVDSVSENNELDSVSEIQEQKDDIDVVPLEIKQIKEEMKENEKVMVERTLGVSNPNSSSISIQVSGDGADDDDDDDQDVNDTLDSVINNPNDSTD